MKSKQPIFFFLFSFFMSSLVVLGQIPQVPSTLQFADLTIKINPQAMREIQLDVDAQYRNPAYFKIKQERVNLYMPIIERVLAENEVPLDLKFLVIQESALISDAVSTSNAVGFWQFKKATAEEVFLRVDNQIDERKNIVSSTRGAALYLKKHNKTFDNWMAALVSYQMGLGGAKAYFGTSQHSKKTIEVNKDTYWYFKKFLAHKIAFEGQTTYLTSNKKMIEVPIQGPVTLSEIARKYDVPENHLYEYNKWTKNGEIPDDRTYSVVFIKEETYTSEPAVLIQPVPEKETEPTVIANETTDNPVKLPYKQPNSFPKITEKSKKSSSKNQILVNGLDGILAKQEISVAKFAKQIKIKESKFRKLNDLGDVQQVKAGMYYYTEKKNTSAEKSTHTVLSGETLWSISQKYGILLSSLKSKNRIRKDTDLKLGMILNLQEPRKRGDKIKIIAPDAPKTQEATVKAPKTESEPIQEVKTFPVQEQVKPENKNPEPSKSSKITHNVIQGETLFAISKKYGVTVDQLKSWNGIGRDNIISIGQKLVIFLP
jgi:membrane-bound lytic murein transglycosylase D